MSDAISILDGLQLQWSRLPGGKLIEDYFDAAPSLRPFYTDFPWTLKAFEKRAEQVRARWTPEHGALLSRAVLATSPRAAAKHGRIMKGEGFVITTGQQAGLFGGPLYTAYKVITAAKLASRLEEKLGVPVVPLFWIPADDHDWDEVNHVHAIDPRNELVRVELAGAAEAPVSMARRVIGPEIEATLEQLAAALPQNDFAAEQIALFRAAYAPGQTMANAYREIITHTFRRFDVLITSSADPALKRFARPVLARELEHAPAHIERLRKQTDRLVEAGYHEQVAIAPDAANVMYEDELGRERLVREADGWSLRRTKRTFTHAELMALLEREPEQFSANVLLRPVVESFAFPTLAYVGGPAEISYFGQTGCLFAAHEVPMPLVFPRVSADLIEAKIRKVLDKFDLTPDDLRRPFHELASQIARDELPPDVSALLHQLRDGLTSGYAALASAATSIDATLRGPLESARNASHKQVDDAERKILALLKKQNEIGLEQLRKAAVHLYPDGQRQERVIGTIAYLGKYGPALLDAIVAAPDLPSSFEL